MKTNTHFDKVVVDTAKLKRSKFGMNYDVNTTADIGTLQPLCCKLLVPGSKTTMSSKHLVRLTAMVAPTFTRMKQKVWHHFVGMSDLSRRFEAFLTKQKVAVTNGTMFQVPYSLPYAPLADLSAFVLLGSQMSVYVFDTTHGSDTADGNRNTWILYKQSSSATANVDLHTWVTGLFQTGYSDAAKWPGFSGGAVDLKKLTGGFYTNSWMPVNNRGVSDFFRVNQSYYAASAKPVALSEANYVLRNSITIDGRSYEVAVAVRLSSIGKRIRKILLGCGYQINFFDTSEVSLMPLFAWYKAYFDTFGLALYESWESTYAHYLLNDYDNGALPGLDLTKAIFCRFMVDLGNCFVTEDYDYVSAHQPTDNMSSAASGSSKDRGFVNNIVLNTPGSTNGRSGIGQSSSQLPVNMASTGHVYINRTNHTEVDAELLKILYKWTNRETAAGKRIAELLRAGGYGKYVDEQKSNFIGYDELDIQVTDVNATADSSNTTTGHNSIVGEYVGKGVGVTNSDPKKFSFENDEFGYWVTLTAIVPESGYCQGIDQELYKVSADSFYSADFDGLGMELERKSLMLGGTDWQDNRNAAQTQASFGLVPRHTCFKVKNNVCNGDMSLRGVRDGYLPFMLDKWIDAGNRNCQLDTSFTDGDSYVAVRTLDYSDLPVGGQSWRYLNRYPWLNNFVRIFASYASDFDEWINELRGMQGITNYEYCHNDYDHFILSNMMNLVTYAPMKPISESYGTTDENDGNGDTTMSVA